VGCDEKAWMRRWVKYPFIDGKRMAAAGGSYGAGYMANWIATHTDRFHKAISESRGNLG